MSCNTQTSLEQPKCLNDLFTRSSIHLNENEQNQLKSLLIKYQSVFSFCQIYFLREEGVLVRSRYKRVEIRVVFGCVFNFMMCLKVIYTDLIKTEIGNWNSDYHFQRACAICE